jgi:hypothetical protein
MSDAHGLPTELRVLTNFEDVIDVLGGVVAVSKLTQRSASAVCNWRNAGAVFPASQYKRIRKALLKRGFIAADQLFTFLSDEPNAEPEANPVVRVA